MKRIVILGAAVLGIAFSLPSMATVVLYNDTSFHYTGTVTAPNGTTYTIPGYTSTPGSTSYDGRDVSLYIDQTDMYFDTNWYSSLNGNNDGSGNPNNQNVGFFQLYDVGTTAVTSMTGSWNAAHTVFNITVTGSNPTTAPYSGYSRLWEPPVTGDPASGQAGYFNNYTFTLTANFNPGDVTLSNGMWTTSAAPTSVSGSMIGTFTNTSTYAGAINGLYSFALDIGMGSWAGSNNIASYNGASTFAVSVPEPAKFALFGLAGFGLLGLLLLRRRYH